MTNPETIKKDIEFIDDKDSFDVSNFTMEACATGLGLKPATSKTMNAIHRKQVQCGVMFTAPKTITFAWQEARNSFSVWYRSDDATEVPYVILGTGHEFTNIDRIIQTIVMPDGFHVFHLCEVGL